MDIKIQWRQDYKFLPDAGVASKREALPKPVWQNFDLRDIAHMSRNHALRLFSQGVPVRINENGTYLVNREDIKKDYITMGKKAVLIADCQPSEKPVNVVGFLG